MPGTIRVNRQGKGFLDPEDSALPEIVIPESATGTALNGDRVLVRRNVERGQEGETGAVVLHSPAQTRSKSSGPSSAPSSFCLSFPMTLGFRMIFTSSPPRDTGRPANIGDKVVVELREWESRHTNPEGEIIEVLGPPDAEGVDMLFCAAAL